MKRRDARRTLSSLEEMFEAARDKSAPPYPCDAKTGEISLPPRVEMELRQLAASASEIEAVRKTTKPTDAGLRASKDYADDLPGPGK